MSVFRLKNFDDDCPCPDEHFTGEWIVEWPNGVTKFRANYIDGKEDGERFCYWENVNLTQKGRMCRGECVGRWTNYHEDGFKTSEYDFIDGQIQGVKKSFWRNGALMYLHTYRESVLHGVFRAYRHDGSCLYEGVYRDGAPWSGTCEIDVFEKQADGGYTLLGEFAEGVKIRDLPLPSHEEEE